MTDNAPNWKDLAPEGRLLRPSEVASHTGLSKSQIYQMIKDGEFPPFIKIGKRASALPQSWLDAYVSYHATRALECRKFNQSEAMS